MKAIRLQTEYLKEPLGLGNPRPRFFWNCDGGIAQTAYRIVCARGGETVWDSGKVASAAMTHVRYEGKPLHSRDRVDWSVQLWDENDKGDELSESWFELGLLEQRDFSARWISGDYRPKKNRRYPVDCFRKDFLVREGLVSARLYASARGVYDVTVNGTRMEDFILAPGSTDYRKRIQVQTYDVTALLREKNCIELRLADGWYRGSVAAYGVTCVYGTRTSVLAQLELRYADGHTDTVNTDRSWAWSNDGPIRFADLKDGEVYDASLRPGYSGRAVEVKAPASLLLASDNVPVTEHERLKPTLLTAADGTRVLDFGQNIAGYLSFSVKGERGQKLTLRCGELLDEQGHVDLRNIQETIPAKGWTQLSLIRKLMTNSVRGETTLSPRQEIVFLCSGDEDSYKSAFTVFGFRYVQVEGGLEIDPSAFTAIAVYSDMEQTGEFRCSDEKVNQLVRNTRWSMKGNFLDVPTDCPTRERLGWTGDAQIFFDTGAYLMNTAPFFAKWLKDMEDAQYKDGSLPAVLPFSGAELMYRSTGASVGWADAIYLIPYRYYKRFGDEDALRSCWPMIQKYGTYLLGRLEKDGHYEKGVHLGEWLEPVEFREKKYGAGMKHPEECTAYLYHAMTTLARIAEIVGDTACVPAYRKAAADAKAVYPRYAETDTDRQAKLVRPLALGLLDGESKTAAQRQLKQAVEAYRYRVGTGFLSTPFLLPVLTEAGEAESAYRMLLNTDKPGWLYEIEQSATTVWEDWDGAGSRNHYSPGAVCQWLFDTCAGIRVAGENHFLIVPIPGGKLSYAEAGYSSLYGEVRSRWERTDDGIVFTVTVPANCTAEIRLPKGRRENVTAGRYTYEA